MFELVHSKGIQRYQIDPSLDLDTTRKSLEIIADAWVNQIMRDIVNNDFPYYNNCKELQDMMTSKDMSFKEHRFFHTIVIEEFVESNQQEIIDRFLTIKKNRSEGQRRRRERERRGLQ